MLQGPRRGRARGGAANRRGPRGADEHRRRARWTGRGRPAALMLRVPDSGRPGHERGCGGHAPPGVYCSPLAEIYHTRTRIGHGFGQAHLEVPARRGAPQPKRQHSRMPRFPMLKTLAAFSFEAQPDLDRDTAAAKLVFVGGVGTGKT